jgi:hypothetical protein
VTERAFAGLTARTHPAAASAALSFDFQCQPLCDEPPQPGSAWLTELRCWEMIDFLTNMPANTVIFITMAVLGLAGMLIVLRRLISRPPSTFSLRLSKKRDSRRRQKKNTAIASHGPRRPRKGRRWRSAHE